MIEVGLRDVEFIAINTDAQQLVGSNADVKLEIGRELTHGLGAGGDPDVGRRAAEESRDEIEEALIGSDMIFVTTGEGGGTGTGAAPVVARIARSLNALTVGVVTRPFSFEGARRASQADSGIDTLRDEVDTLITISNDKLLEMSNRTVGATAAFSHCNQVLLNGVQGITDLIQNPGVINVDFADVCSVMKDAGTALMGIGVASGEDRAVVAAEAAVSSPLFEVSVDGALGVLVNVEGPPDVGLHEYADAVRLITEAAHSGAHIIGGLGIDESLGDQVKVTVIAAGFDAASPRTDAAGLAPNQMAAPKLPNSIPPTSSIPLNNSSPKAYQPAGVAVPVGAGVSAPVEAYAACANAASASVASAMPAGSDPYPPSALSMALNPALAAATVVPPKVWEPIAPREELDVPDFLKR